MLQSPITFEAAHRGECIDAFGHAWPIKFVRNAESIDRHGNVIPESFEWVGTDEPCRLCGRPEWFDGEIDEATYGDPDAIDVRADEESVRNY